MTKSIAFTEYGSADVLHVQESEVPAPGPGQVRIAVRAAGVNPLDHKVRAGFMQDAFPVEFPHVPGAEASGVIEAVGEGVEGLVVGDEVFGRTLSGAYAEQAVADASRLTLKPDTLSWEQAAAIPVAAETSYRVLELLGVRPGETLLIHGAAGGVGTVAVQLAVARGVKVIGTASEGNHRHLRDLGAIPVLYGEGLVERVRAVAPDGVDAALDTSGRPEALAASIELIGGTDRVVEIGNPGPAGEFGVRFSAGGPDEDRSEPAFTEVLALVASGRLSLPIHRAYPLTDAAQAQRASEAGHLTGKIVLTV
ncbi:NADPH:quinone reductase [Streptomyces sp. DvalAA-14]|uniref:quinone oxidoreductase family protein n=1 Tax=unclassified Streptomyces TaxID=2593676 RepID=UPI00081BB227|nr:MULTISPECIES: NADP-dependent oxidoreductase [unclassified Streptomyces]MYS19767.1 zinc-binding dehydrogenase [Streptomyces sp. SID4948]SCD52679.1 NADPH:quinone reductase [Streptomyces sp. DvalAA-14]